MRQCITKKRLFGLAHFGVPHEHWNKINTEQDLNSYQHDISNAFNREEDIERSNSPSITASDLPSSPPSKFPPLVDHYHEEISHPLPLGTIVGEGLNHSQPFHTSTDLI